MTADRAEDRILVGNRFLDVRWMEHVPCDNGEVCMPSGQGKRIAREGGDIVSLVQRLFNQASTSDAGGSKDCDMHIASLHVPRGVLLLKQRCWIPWNEVSVAARTTLEASLLALRGS